MPPNSAAAIAWKLGPFHFCSRLDALDEIIDCRTFFPIEKNGPEVCHGLSAVRGQMVHVLSPRWLFQLFGLSSPTVSDLRSMIGKKLILFNAGRHRWGIPAEEMGALIDLGALDPKPWVGATLKKAQLATWEGNTYFICQPSELVRDYEQDI